MKINENEVRDFSQNYTHNDFRLLVEEQASDGFIRGIGVGDDGIGFAADCLYYDYQEGRANAFGYVLWEMSGRTLMELRKSAILQFPIEFIEWFGQDSNHTDVIAKRIEKLEPWLAEYRDVNWQYDWAVHLFIPKQKRDWLEYTFEEYMVDGDLERDVWVDPLWSMRFDKLYIFDN